MFMQMQKDVFIANAKLLKEEYHYLKPNFYNANYEHKLWLLLKFVTRWYCNYWRKKT